MVTKVSLFSYKFTRATWVGGGAEKEYLGEKPPKCFPGGLFFLCF